MDETYYIKKNGRYIPLNDPYAYDGLGNGTWLVVVKGGSTKARTLIDTKNVELDAALEVLAEELSHEMMEQSKIRPLKTKISAQERKAWDAFEKILGKNIPCYMGYQSIHDIAYKSCEKIKKIMVENKCDIKKIKEKYKKKKIFKNSISTLELDE